MNKARKKFIINAECAMFILLTLLLSIINIVNFTMVSEDADHLTGIIAEKNGSFGRDSSEAPPIRDPLHQNKRYFDSMAPDSPDNKASARYFTFAFDENGNAEKIAFNISAVTEEEAEKWAKS